MIRKRKLGKLFCDNPLAREARTSGISQGTLCLFNQSLEGDFVMNGQLGQGLAIQLDSGFFQTGHKSAVGNPVHSTGSIDANNPQFAEFTFLVTSVAVGKLAGAISGLFRVPIQPARVSEISLGLTQRALATLAGCLMVLYFWHVLLSLLDSCQAAFGSPGRAALLVPFRICSGNQS